MVWTKTYYMSYNMKNLFHFIFLLAPSCLTILYNSNILCFHLYAKAEHKSRVSQLILSKLLHISFVFICSCVLSQTLLQCGFDNFATFNYLLRTHSCFGKMLMACGGLSLKLPSLWVFHPNSSDFSYFAMQSYFLSQGNNTYRITPLTTLLRLPNFTYQRLPRCIVIQATTCSFLPTRQHPFGL